MFLSQSNRKIICDSIDETLPKHLKDRTLIDKNMQIFINQIDNKKSMIENNKAFLMFHVKSQIQVFDFDKEMKNQMDLEEVVLKPPVIQVEEVIDENTMENEVRIKMEQRQKEMESILSQQKPIIIEPESTSIHEKKVIENYEDKYEKPQIPKRVSFQEPEPDITSKMDIILLELNIIKQEISELKKMFVILSRINPNESQTLFQP